MQVRSSQYEGMASRRWYSPDGLVRYGEIAIHIRRFPVGRLLCVSEETHTIEA